MVKIKTDDERIKKRDPNDMIGTVIMSEKEQLIVVLKDLSLWKGHWHQAWIVEDESGIEVEVKSV